MTIGEIIKIKDKETYKKLIKMSGGNKHGKKMDKTNSRKIHKRS